MTIYSLDVLLFLFGTSLLATIKKILQSGFLDFLRWLSSKELPSKQEIRIQDWEDPLEKEMAPHSSIPAWEIPWTEKPSGLYSSWGHKRAWHDLLTKNKNNLDS